MDKGVCPADDKNMRSRSLLVLAAGFSILLVLIAVSCGITVNEARRIFTEQSEISRAYQNFQTDLEVLRSEIYLASIYVRDLMLDSRSAAADEQRERLVKGEQAVQSRLKELQSFMAPELAADIDALSEETELYWASLAPALEDPDIRTSPEFASLRRQFMARRDSALEIVGRIEEINRNTLQDRQAQLAESQTRLIRYIIMTGAVAFGLGLIVAAASGRRIYKLQLRADRQRLQTEKAEAEMRRLSAQLLQAQEEERRRLSRELHDEVGQTLTALGMELGNLERLRDGPLSVFREHLKDAKRLMQDTLATVRSIAMGLRPSMLDDSGLVPALRWQIREFSKRSGIEVDVQIEGELELIDDLQRTCIYRVVQEALTNCARHSRARHAWVELRGRPPMIELRVIDDGVGFVAKERLPGIGLMGIEERVRELGGRLSVTSRPGKGASLAVEIPLKGVEIAETTADRR
jgi:signal transduction histidine kinase